MPKKGGKKLYKRNGVFNMGRYFPVEDLRKFATTNHGSLKNTLNEYNKLLRKAMTKAAAHGGEAAVKRLGGRKLPELPPTPKKDPPVDIDTDSNDLGTGKRKLSNGSSTGRPAKLAKHGKHNVVIGKTGRRFGRARKSRDSKYAKPGVQLVYETRAAVSDAQCVYVGYGIPTNQAIKSLMYCLVKKLFTCAGYQVKNFDETIPRSTSGNYTIVISFYASQKSTGLTTIQASHTYVAGQLSYINFADNLHNALDTFVTSSQSIFQIDWSKAVLTGTDTAGASSALAEIPLDRTRIDLSFGATCRVQNVTQASGGTGDAKLSTDRIDINPLKGLKYVGQRINNCLIPRIRDDATQAGWLAFMPDRDSGLFTNTALGLTGAAVTPGTFPEGMSQGFNKPPKGSSFIATKTVGVSIEPGEIRHDKMYWKYKGSFQDFFTRVMSQVQDRNTTNQVNFGKVAMFAFEHAVCQTTESNVAVDFQVDWKIGTAISFKKPSTVPVVRIQ